MKILVMDAQGGGIGKQLVTALKDIDNVEIIAVGTNSVATTAMLKAGATAAATGENAVIVNARDADVIVGPIGIAIADAMYGEVSPKMAEAIGASCAKRILIPFQHCGSYIVGVQEENTGKLTSLAIEEVKKYIQKKS